MTWEALAAGGLMLQGVSSYQQGKEARDLARQQAAATMADAEAAKKEAAEAARLKRREAASVKGSQIASFAAAGVSPLTLSPLAIITFTQDQMAKDAETIQERGITAYERLKSESKWQKKAGASAYRAGLWGAGSSLLAGAGMYGSYKTRQDPNYRFKLPSMARRNANPYGQREVLMSWPSR